jgi:PilZ domain
MTNRREDRRYQVTVLAALMSRKDELICFGKVKDVSAGGAKLELLKEKKLPEEFVMVFSSQSGPRRDCSLAWQAGQDVGVRFKPPAKVKQYC